MDPLQISFKVALTPAPQMHFLPMYSSLSLTLSIFKRFKEPNMRVDHNIAQVEIDTAPNKHLVNYSGVH